MGETDKIWNILMVGVGGQGIVLASDLLAQAALLSGFDAKKSEIHGMSQRGGSVFSHIRFGKKVYAPVIPEASCDILVSLELLETLRWTAYCHPQTKAIVLTEKILPASAKEYPSGIETEIKRIFADSLFIDPASLIPKIKDKPYLNVALCGLLANFLPLGPEAWQKALEECIPPNYYEENWRAFKEGRLLGCK